MNKFKEILNSYFWLFIIFFLLFIGWMAFSIYSSHQANEFNQKIENQKIDAGILAREATRANTNAANSDIERRTEDVIRQKTITPKLERARLNSQNSKIELEKAKRKLNETTENLHNANASRADNCSELRQLFPNEVFEYCHD